MGQLPQTIYLYPKNTQTIKIIGLQDAESGDYLDSGTCLATLFDDRGNPDTVLINVTMDYVPDSDGDYTGIVTLDFDAAPGAGYTLQVQAVQSGIQALWSFPAVVKLRTQ